MSVSFQDRTGLLGVEFTRERVRFWAIRSGLSVLDQGLISGAGFLLNLLLARWLTSESYGAFAVAFATVLFLSGCHNVLVLEPMMALGPARYSAEITEYFFAQLKLNTLVVGTLSGLVLLATAVMAALRVHHELLAATLASAVALPFLLLFWLVRRMCYVVQRPPVAASASAAYLALMLSGLFVLHVEGWLDVGRAFLLVAAISTVAALVVLRQLGLLGFGGKAACSWRHIASENWNYGRWLMASAILYPFSSQVQTYLAAGMIGLGAAGVLRAMQIPALVMTQIVTAVGLLVLPVMSQEFGVGRTDKLRKKAMLSTLVLTAMAFAYEAVLGFFAKPVEHILFGGKFATYAWLIPVLGLVPLFTSFGTGFAMALRALQKPQYDLVANAVAAPVGILTAIVFIKIWGISGAALSLAVASAALAAVLLRSFTQLQRRA